jgi:hypothetical protein
LSQLRCRERAAGEPFETRLAHEELDRPERGDSRNVMPAEEAANARRRAAGLSITTKVGRW